MDDRTPDTPERLPDADTADPHRAEPAPPAQEGLRPGVDPSVVRPAEDEPVGPMEGLLGAAAAEAAHEAPGDSPEAEAQTLYLGVEDEGVESSQIFGLMLATALSIIALGLGIYFLFYLPKLQATEIVAEDVPLDRYVELRETRAAADNLIGQYSTDAEGNYRIPVGAAMALVAEEYAGESRREYAGLTTRTDYNLSWITLNPAPAVVATENVGGIVLPQPSLPAVEASLVDEAVAAEETEAAAQESASPESEE